MAVWVGIFIKTLLNPEDWKEMKAAMQGVAERFGDHDSMLVELRVHERKFDKRDFTLMM